MAVCLSVQSNSGMQRLACRDELVWSSIYCDTEKHELLKHAMLYSGIYIYLLKSQPLQFDNHTISHIVILFQLIMQP